MSTRDWLLSKKCVMWAGFDLTTDDGLERAVEWWEAQEASWSQFPSPPPLSEEAQRRLAAPDAPTFTFRTPDWSVSLPHPKRYTITDRRGTIDQALPKVDPPEPRKKSWRERLRP